MTVVEVFKTNVSERQQAQRLMTKLITHFPQCRINFDLQDCDRILRVEGKQFPPEKIIALLETNGYECHVLD